uniref:Uncharacterized protein n=1 Tax=Ralstonia solanacearum CFBP2957 TaxID=859656 RepID=D8P5Y1_RALSL|nr:protein of unknown function [Ralstonia solanacearum CFBP2957]
MFALAEARSNVCKNFRAASIVPAGPIPRAVDAPTAVLPTRVCKRLSIFSFIFVPFSYQLNTGKPAKERHEFAYQLLPWIQP